MKSLKNKKELKKAVLSRENNRKTILDLEKYSALLLFAIPSGWVLKGKWWILNIIRDYLVGVEQIRNKPTDLSILFLFVMGRLLLIAVQFLICFSALGTQISFYGCVLFSVVTSLLMIVNITPAALGVREVIVGAIAATTGHYLPLRHTRPGRGSDTLRPYRCHVGRPRHGDRFTRTTLRIPRLPIRGRFYRQHELLRRQSGCA